MSKNVVVCCDGTANEFARDNTNVVKLFQTLTHASDRQVTYYHPGIGTMEAPGALTTVGRFFTRLAGMAFGYGLQADIRDAYVFIMNNYEPGDRLYLFGFSRGAYTVRIVASLLKLYGLIRRGNEPLVPYAIRRMHAINREADARVAFDLALEFKTSFCGVDCRPYFVGIWDCVSSVGWFANPLRVPYSADNPDIEIGRHAVSIDERRAFFRSNLWHLKSAPPASGPRDLQQVWFAGVHCDVGGGYSEQQSGLAKISLAWMLQEANDKGLLLELDRVDVILGRTGEGHAAPNALADMHESLTWKWWPAEFVPKPHFDWRTHSMRRRMNLFRRRTIPENSLVHCSVKARLDKKKGYTPLLPAAVVFVPKSEAIGNVNEPT